MSRAGRLLELLQALRRRRRPVKGSTLAEELGISVRTLYRDIQALRANGATIKGEAGVGYLLEPGYMLPPLMLSQRELEAMTLGLRWVQSIGDPKLVESAIDAGTKISEVLPTALKRELDEATLLVGPRHRTYEQTIDLEEIRAAIRGKQRLRIEYVNKTDEASERIVWPLALAYLRNALILVSWCELRSDYRHFRADRIFRVALAGGRYTKPRRALLKAWKLALFKDRSLVPVG